MSPLERCERNDPISRETVLWIIVQKITSHWTPAVSGLKLLFLALVSGLKIWAVKIFGSSDSQIQRCYLLKAGWGSCTIYYVIYSKRSPILTPPKTVVKKEKVVWLHCILMHNRWPTSVLSRWKHKEKHYICVLWDVPMHFSVLFIFSFILFVFYAQKWQAQWKKAI